MADTHSFKWVQREARGVEHVSHAPQDTLVNCFIYNLPLSLGLKVDYTIFVKKKCSQTAIDIP